MVKIQIIAQKPPLIYLHTSKIYDLRKSLYHLSKDKHVQINVF